MNSKTISTYKDWMKTTAFRDFIAVGIIAFQAIILVEVLELGKALTKTATQEAWPIDKFITVPIIIALAITFYAQGRLKEPILIRYSTISRRFGRAERHC
jgi:hypothetical protein